MATIEKRGQFWRGKIRRTGLPAQSRSFDNRTQAQQWARGVESESTKALSSIGASRCGSRSLKSCSGTGAK